MNMLPYFRSTLILLILLMLLGGGSLLRAGDDVYTVVQGTTLTANGVGGNPPGVLANDDAGATVATLTKGPASGSLTLAADGSFTYTPSINARGSVTFTYIENSPAGSTVVAATTSSTWKYLNPLRGVDPDNGVNQFNATWKNPNFDATAWGNGTGVMGYGVLAGISGTVALTTDLGTPDSGHRRTAYFRRSFNSTQTGPRMLHLKILREDAAIIYLNGVEVGRTYEPGAAAVFTTAPDTWGLMVPGTAEAWTAEGDEEITVHDLIFPNLSLLPGDNVLAVSVHNNLNPTTALSSDLGLKVEVAEFWALRTVTIHLITPEISLEEPVGTRRETSRVVAWGDNGNGQTTVPAGLSDVQAIAARQSQTVALRSNGSVLAWGTNTSGQTTVPAGLSGVQAIAAGAYHSVALKEGGTVVAWGSNSDGQRTIPAGLSGVVAIAAGSLHTVALKNDGTVVAWGSNSEGQRTIPAGLSGVVAIAAGYNHTVALKSDGTVVAWGYNNAGQTVVPPGLSAVRAIAAGDSHTLALKCDGTVVAWGSDAYGQTTVPVGLSSVQAIAADYEHSVALKNDGTVVAWGYNGNGGTTIPVGLSSVQAIAAGNGHTVALTSGRVVFADQPRFTSSAPKVMTLKNPGNAALQIYGVEVLSGNAADFSVDPAGMATTLPAGDGQTTFRVTFTPTGPGWRQTRLRVVSDDLAQVNYEIILAGYAPLDADLAVFTGADTAPEAERTNDQVADAFPTTVLGEFSASQTFTIKNTGASDVLTGLKWEVIGANAVDFVGSSYGAASLAPGGTANLTITFVPKAVGPRTATLRIYSDDPDESPFAINFSGNAISREIEIEQPAGTGLESSQIFAWGNNGSSQATIPEGLSGVWAIAAGNAHTVALKSDGTVIAWGRNTSGQTTIPAGLSGVIAIAAGYYHTVALKGDGTVVALGNNGYGQSTIPVGLSGVRAIAAGDSHTVALKIDGTVVAWGRNTSGQTTIPAGLSGVQAIAAGNAHTVGLKGDGTVVAWGYNASGQTTIPAGVSDAQAIAAGSTHTVAVRGNSTVAAWGSNGSGQTTIPAGLSGVVAIEAGVSHTVGLKSDGTVVAWGDNGSGQTTIPVGLSGVRAIAAGDYHTVALKASTVGFGTQPLSLSASAGKTFTIKNPGLSVLHIAGVSMVGADAAAFSISTAGMLTSVPALTGLTTFKVTFQPSSLGLKSAWLRIGNDDYDEGNFVIQLTGTGIPPLAPQAVRSLPAQQVLIGTPLTLELAHYFITNGGGALTYSVVGNSTPAAITATVSGSGLQLTGLSPGVTSISIRVRDSYLTSTVITLNATAVTQYPPPNNPPPFLLSTPTRLADGSVLLEFPAILGQSYQMESSPDLTTWTPRPPILQAGASQLLWRDLSLSPAPPRLYYRARVLPTP